MIIHYFKATIRILKRNKLNLIINLFGLTIGLTASFLILNYILFEIGYDNYHKKKKRIYRVLNEKKDVQWTSPLTPYILSEYLKNDIAEIERITPIGYLVYAQIKSNNEFEKVKNFRTATNDIFKIFTIDFLEGNPENALTDPFSVVITETMARKYFPAGSPLGKIIELNDNGEIYNLTIKGVVKDFPKQSTFTANFIGNIELDLKSFERMPWSSSIRTNWGLTFYNTYLLLKEEVAPSVVEEKFRGIEKIYMGDQINFKFSLQRLRDIYLGSSHLVNSYPQGNLTNIYLFAAIGLSIILIACFNYIILSVAQSTLRAKEIGIRKVVGGSRKDIIKQILGESILISFIAFPLALLLEKISMPKMNQLFGTQLEINFAENINLLLIFILITLLIGVVEDFHVHSLHENIAPLRINITHPKFVSQFIVKYRPGSFIRVHDYCKSKWQELAPDTYFGFQFFGEALDDLYKEEIKLGKITGLFGFIAVLIAFFGLFGLSLFTARQRTQEIGIRKVHGAKTTDILTYYGKAFLTITLLANIISWPVVYYILNKWLQNFSYHININFLIFAISAVVSISIVSITILTHSIKSAHVNPASTLRYE